MTKSSKEIIETFYKLSANKKVDILYSALDYMQQYNGRTINMCICLAMGYEDVEITDEGSLIWKKRKQ